MVKNFEDICIRFDTTHERDTHTDTAWRHRPRLCIASRGKNRIRTLSILKLSPGIPGCENCMILRSLILSQYKLSATKSNINNNNIDVKPIKVASLVKGKRPSSYDIFDVYVKRQHLHIHYSFWLSPASTVVCKARYTGDKVDHIGNKVETYRQQGRPQQAVEFMLLPICCRFRQHSTWR